MPEDLTVINKESPYYQRVRNLIDNFGGMEGYLASEMNTWQMAAYRKDELPELLFTCGTDDRVMYERYCRFRDYAERIGLGASFITVEGYGHEWEFWDISIRRGIQWLLDE